MTGLLHRDGYFWLALAVRALFILLGCLIDGLSRLRFTDVDYLVFSAAADNVLLFLKTGDTGNLRFLQILI